MEAATLVTVTDSISKGASYLPSAGSTAGQIPSGTVGAGPSPTPAINSGTKLNSSLLAASNQVSNGQGKQYASKDDAGIKGVNSNTDGTKAGNE